MIPCAAIMLKEATIFSDITIALMIEKQHNYRGCLAAVLFYVFNLSRRKVLGADIRALSRLLSHAQFMFCALLSAKLTVTGEVFLQER